VKRTYKSHFEQERISNDLIIRTVVFFAEMLALSRNNIQSTIPQWIGHSWPNLQSFLINGNLVEGTLPSSFLAMTNLRKCDEKRPQTKDTAPRLTDSTHTVAFKGHLELQTNQNLGGNFDEVMRAIPTLEYLDISNTDVEGTIPSEITMSELRVFKARNTRNLIGTIPKEIGGWTKLGMFSFQEICEMLLARPFSRTTCFSGSMVETFSVDNLPELTGSLVTEFGLLTNLKTLKITNAPITGPLPTELGWLPNLKTMNLSFLNLESTLPIEYVNLSTLERMDFNINYGLVGTIPTEYGDLVNLSK
jgi:hypothetical protein